MRHGFWAAAAAWAVILAGSAADATVTTFTWRGSVSYGQDYTGVLGTPGANLAGADFSATFFVDDASANISSSIYTEGGITYGSLFLANGGNTAIQGNVTIGGQAVAIKSSNLGLVDKLGGLNPDGSYSSGISMTVVDLLPTDNDAVVIQRLISFGFSNRTRLLFGNGDYHAPLFQVPRPGDTAVGSFLVQLVDSVTESATEYLFARLAIESLTVTGGIGAGDGSSGTAPLFPSDATPDGGLVFGFDVLPAVSVFIDPPVATGYDYVVDGSSPLIATASFPVIPGDADGYQVYALTDLTTPLFAHVLGGQVIDFTTLPGYAAGIAGFALRGIDVAGHLDPMNPTAFITALTFASAGHVSLMQTPVTTDYAPGVPEPGSWAMLIAGFGIVGAGRRRLRRIAGTAT